MTDKKVFHSCESVDNVLFDLNGDRHVGLGWVVFEMDDGRNEQVSGAIGVNNNIFTLKLLRHLNAQKPLRIVGYFADSMNKDTQSYELDNVMPLSTLFNDEIGFILFRATVVQVHTKM